ncbi:alpha-amylase family protein [Kineosporia mesophila]|uniref:Alpha-amylase family protein n=1 Tax=Kineosporia mesophila TaxID=566012 RepID=A0ABP6ZW64_9ACTN|nr:alpha-amylase family protein [Kineosporia mesophila]MCD5348616.1 alpha-amylase family protein [Kineosporia mesophila]
MRITDTADMWWKTAVVYCLDVETFMDWNDDGTGDLAGLAQRIDYLSELGVTCLWLMPFYPSPDRDDGYDITDFYGVDPRLGTHGDLVEAIRTAHDRGMRVIVDLVVNHTSDQHPWFVASRESKDSPYRDWYVWVDEPPAGQQPEPVFPDQESSVWTLDEKTGQYYLHHFYKYQPDLNVTNPAVRDEIARIVGFWLALGVSGFRVDAVPFFIDTIGESPTALPDPHQVVRDLRAFINRRSGDAILLGEVNVPFKQQLEFFGGSEGDELTLQFDFITMQNMYLALARQNAGPLQRALEQRPEIPRECQWGTFVRNHDELTLDKLSDSERQEVFDAFGPQKRMQVYGRGLIRRLPPMLDGDADRIRMVYSLLFSLPGTPVLFYGEEIGMGENLEIGDRTAVRTPMQWTSEPGAGFSRNDDAETFPAPLVTGEFGPEHVNVQAQRADPDSLLNFVRLLIARYRSSPELGWGDFEVLPQSSEQVFVHRSTWEDAVIIAMHNFGPDPVTVPLELEPGSTAIDLLSPHDEEIKGEVDLGRYGYRWLRVITPTTRRLR